MSETLTLIIRDRITRARAVEAIRGLGEGEWQMVIRPHKSTRSIQQNRLAFAWYGEIQTHLFESTGQSYDTWELHEFFVSKLMPRKAIQVGGKVALVRSSSSHWDVATFTDYLRRLEAYCRDNLDLQLSHDDDLWYEELSKTP